MVSSDAVCGNLSALTLEWVDQLNDKGVVVPKFVHGTIGLIFVVSSCRLGQVLRRGIGKGKLRQTSLHYKILLTFCYMNSQSIPCVHFLSHALGPRQRTIISRERLIATIVDLMNIYFTFFAVFASLAVPGSFSV